MSRGSAGEKSFSPSPPDTDQPRPQLTPAWRPELLRRPCGRPVTTISVSFSGFRSADTPGSTDCLDHVANGFVHPFSPSAESACMAAPSLTNAFKRSSLPQLDRHNPQPSSSTKASSVGPQTAFAGHVKFVCTLSASQPAGGSSDKFAGEKCTPSNESAAATIRGESDT